jgi:hypothetical protein
MGGEKYVFMCDSGNRGVLCADHSLIKPKKQQHAHIPLLKREE